MMLSSAVKCTAKPFRLVGLSHHGGQQQEGQNGSGVIDQGADRAFSRGAMMAREIKHKNKRKKKKRAEKQKR
jgi:hypothetical protein